MLEKRFEEFIIPDLNSDKRYPGFSTCISLKLFSHKYLGRKYIFDYAQKENQNRISLFLDPNNNLVFEIIDNVGELNNVKIPSNEYSFNKDMVICCEYGIIDEFSFMRFFIDKRFIEQSKFRFKINLPNDVEKKIMFGYDISGNYGTIMTLHSCIAFKAILDKKTRDSLFAYWLARLPSH